MAGSRGTLSVGCTHVYAHILKLKSMNLACGWLGVAEKERRMG